MERFLPCRNFLVKAQAAHTLWEFVGLRIYKRMYENKQNLFLGYLWSKWSTSTGGPLWPVGLIRSKLVVPCQKILVSISTLPSSNQTFSQNRIDHFNLFGNFGCFPFNQNVWFAFLATSSREWHSIFQNL